MNGNGAGNKAVWITLAGVLAALFVISRTSGLIVQWLWMGRLDFGVIFWRVLSMKASLFTASFAAVLLYVWINLRLPVRRFLTRHESGGRISITTEQGFRLTFGTVWIRRAPLMAAIITGLLFAAVLYPQWDTYLRFQEGNSFGMADPVFGRDAGFYVFRLPFYELIQNSLAVVTFMAFALTVTAYFYSGSFEKQSGKREDYWFAVRHSGILFILFTAAWGWGYYLDRFGLLYSTRGVTFGAGYTDLTVVRTGLWIMLFASAALILLIVANFFIKKIKLFPVIIGGYLGMILIVLFLLPVIIQKFKVQPNELELESTYIKYNINFTRAAYGLDRIEQQDYPGRPALSREEIPENSDTIRNIRLWDWRPIRQTYRQTQEIRAYYKFYEVDVDRYRLDEGYRQVMLSARELEETLPPRARTWVNERLQYTHGFGLAMSLVSEKVEEGLPDYLIRDLPPETSGGLTVKQPAVYYGEKTPGYRIVSTRIKEFDYPKGDENVYTNYAGSGGVPLDSFWKKLLFAWHSSDINILLSSYITPESKIQLWRQARQRVSRIAPFLRLDNDPYLVLHDGRLYWIQDAYTVSSSFPYSEPSGNGINYIRNSVKAVIDAYEGSVTFYTADPDDPLISVYRRGFPGVFRDLDEMPEGLRAHLRYPQDMFSIQVEKLMTYHMTVPQVFYNKEDLWILPREKYAGSPIQLEPYYILIRLPEGDGLEYLIMTPVTPSNRDNMIAWIAGKSDFPDYGKMIVYTLPKERLIYGPIQIEAMIDQDDVISQQLSLWDQRGSRVIRGNLIVIPLSESFLYIEPVYLIAEETNIPQLKRVIAVHNKKVVMQPTIDAAIDALFGERPPAAVAGPPAADLSRVRDRFDRAEDAMRDGRWKDFGEAMDALKKSLTRDNGERQ